MKKIIAVTVIVAALALTGCGSDDKDSETTAAADTAVETEAPGESGDTVTDVVGGEDRISKEEALEAIQIYCYTTNPDLVSIVMADEYPVSWEVTSDTENMIIVLFHSYTGAEIRYYIEPFTGETYVTEFVSGITDAEQETGEQFNIRDYMQSR